MINFDKQMVEEYETAVINGQKQFIENLKKIFQTDLVLNERQS